MLGRPVSGNTPAAPDRAPLRRGRTPRTYEAAAERAVMMEAAGIEPASA